MRCAALSTSSGSSFRTAACTTRLAMAVGAVVTLAMGRMTLPAAIAASLARASARAVRNAASSLRDSDAAVSVSVRLGFSVFSSGMT